MTEAPAGPPGSDDPPTPPDRLSQEVRRRNIWTGTAFAALILVFVAITCYTRSVSDQSQPGGKGMYPSPNKPSPTGTDKRPWKNRSPGQSADRPSESTGQSASPDADSSP